MNKPLFIAIEGIDGSGGTTQLGLLAAWLVARGQRVHRTREPSDLPVGRLIRSALADPSRAVSDAALPYLFCADRRDHIDQEIEPSLARGEWVLSDRYWHSSLAYQSEAMPYERVWELNRVFRAPDLTVLLVLEAERALARVEARGGVRDRFERLELLERVAARYERVRQECVARGERLVAIDAGQAPAQVFDELVAELLRLAPGLAHG
jgi:dTMP kinase